MRSTVHRSLVLLAAITAAVAPHVAAAQTRLSYADLVKRLIDLEYPATLPADGEKCAQWSSFDRASKYDEATGKYVNWAANNDGPMFIRQDGDQFVLAEMDGPGCIWRIWSARAEKGHVRIYLDGSDKPAVDLPFEGYFNGETAPFAYPQLSYNLATLGCRGQNLYFPIPYQKSCKVVADKGWGRYYHFTYTTYPAGTQLPTFSTALAAEHAAALQRVNDFFESSLGTDPAGQRADAKCETKEVTLDAGQKATLELTGPRAITAIRATVKTGEREDEMAAMRRLVLQITWDGQDKPAVWCPLGDFFGTAPGVNKYKSLLTGMTDAGGYALWYMPFAKTARVELVNEDKAARTVHYEIVHAPLARPFDGLGHFHCKWHRGTVTLPPDRWPDWTLLLTQGRGRFCGVMLHVWNPRGGWWGEGDEKFFVDGEKFPSTFGTGSEDYFGYAWCHPGLFQRAYHAQTMTQGNRGHQSVLRWHLIDNIPFHSAFEACIEKYFKTEERGTEYATFACWYLAPGGTDAYDPVATDKRHGYYVSAPLTAGGFTVLNEPRGVVSTQKMTRYEGQWHNGDQLWWTRAKPGDKLELAVPVQKAGRYEVRVTLTKARDYGIVQLSVDGKKAGEPVDLYNPAVVPTEPIVLGTYDLTAGQHKLTAEIVGANPKAIPSHMFGLDQVILESKE
jgi:hypothetical protein